MKLILVFLIAIINLNTTYSKDNKEENSEKTEESTAEVIYNEAKLNKYIDLDVFLLAITGFNKIEGLENDSLITIIDYSKPSNVNRMFVIDLKNKKILESSLVAHGQNTGEIYANSFSNSPNSHKSCLGFFLTAETYIGRNGYSLRLDGIEQGINDNSRDRAIVIHGASYVNTSFFEKFERLGRSWGCPALPMETSTEIIDLIKNKSCLFIYANDTNYLNSSQLICG